MIANRHKKSTRVWIAESVVAVTVVVLILAPFAALAPSTSAASYINTAVPSNPNLSSGFIRHQIRFGAGLVLRSFNEVGQYSFVTPVYNQVTV